MVANNNNMAMSIHKKRKILTLMSLCYLLIPGIVSLIGFILFYSAVFFYILPQAQRYYFIFTYANTEHEVLK